MLDNLINNRSNPKARAALLALVMLAATPAWSEKANSESPKDLAIDTRAGAPKGAWYPASARRKNIEGMVLIDFALDSAGSPQDVKAASSDHPQMLEAAAIGFVSEMRFVLPPAWSTERSARHRIYVLFDICPFDPSQAPIGVQSVTIRACRAR